MVGFFKTIKTDELLPTTWITYYALFVYQESKNFFLSSLLLNSRLRDYTCSNIFLSATSQLLTHSNKCNQRLECQ